MTTDLASRIERLEDIESIKNLKHMYCYLADAAIRGNPDKWDEFLSCFVDDAWADFGEFGVHEGKAAVAKFYTEVVTDLLSYSAHMVMNPIIEVNGAAASGKWYVIVPCTLKESGNATWIEAKYEEEYVKKDGRWMWKSIIARFDFFTPYEEGWAKKPFFNET